MNHLFHNKNSKKKEKQNNKEKWNKEKMEKRVKVLLVKKTISLYSHQKKNKNQ